MECIQPGNTAPYIQWIYSMFGTCVYGYQDAFSTVIGYASIFCWIVSQLPQIMKNYELQSANGLSPILLFLWLAGDLGNMFSCVLNHQLPFQTYLAIYFVLTDTILIGQYFYYGQSGIVFTEEDMKIQEDEESPMMMDISSSPVAYGSTDNNKKTVLMGLLLFGIKMSVGTNSLTTTDTIMKSMEEPLITVGWVLAWTCTTFYLTSRVPQILQNYKRRSTVGISLVSFCFSVAGNVTYAISILTFPGHTRHSFLSSVPYLVGSIGTVSLDAIVFRQFIIYKKNTTKQLATVLSRVPTTV